MPQAGDIVEFRGRNNWQTSWKCKLGESGHLHTDLVRVRLGPRSGDRFNDSECLIHPNHKGPAKTSRIMTVIYPVGLPVEQPAENAS